MKYQFKYEYSRPFGAARHVWTCVGAKGAVHFHVSDMGQERAEKYGGERYVGGLETHYRSPPDYMADQAPSHPTCWLLKCPCWSDGTSLYASERLIPFWRLEPDNHDRIFAMLEREYEERFSPRCEAA